MLFRCSRVEDIFDGRFYSCFNVPPLQPKRIVPFRAKCSCVWRGCIWIARTSTGYLATMNMCVLKVWKNHVRIHYHYIYMYCVYKDYRDELKSKYIDEEINKSSNEWWMNEWIIDEQYQLSLHIHILCIRYYTIVGRYTKNIACISWESCKITLVISCIRVASRFLFCIALHSSC